MHRAFVAQWVRFLAAPAFDLQPKLALVAGNLVHLMLELLLPRPNDLHQG